MQSTIKNSHKNQQWHGWLFVHPLHDEAHWRSHKTVVEWCSLEFPQTPSYQYHTETNSLKPLPTSTTQKPIPSNPFFQYHTETNSLKSLPTSTTQKQSDFSRSYYTLQTAWFQTNAWRVSCLLLGASMLQKHTLSTTPRACASRLDQKTKKKHQKKAIIPGTLM